MICKFIHFVPTETQSLPSLKSAELRRGYRATSFTTHNDSGNIKKVRKFYVFSFTHVMNLIVLISSYTRLHEL